MYIVLLLSKKSYVRIQLHKLDIKEEVRLSAGFEVLSGFIPFRTNHVFIGCGKDHCRW